MIADVRQRIKGFLATRLGRLTLADDADIFTVAHVNSLFAVQLLRFVEQEFSIVLQPEDMEFENFRTVDRICDLVDRKKIVEETAIPKLDVQRASMVVRHPGENGATVDDDAATHRPA